MKSLIKKRNLFMSSTLMCLFLSISFSFNSSGIHWFWSDNKSLPIVLILSAIILGILWVRTQKKIKNEKDQNSSL